MALVNLILREEIPKLGAAGDLVKVKPGYARNYLLRQGKAIVATESKVKELEHHRGVIAEKLARELKDLNALKDKIAATPVKFTARAGEEGKLFGSVTASQIADQLAEKGIVVDRRKIELKEHIKDLGEHEVQIRLLSGVIATVKVTVEVEE